VSDPYPLHTINVYKGWGSESEIKGEPVCSPVFRLEQKMNAILLISWLAVIIISYKTAVIVLDKADLL